MLYQKPVEDSASFSNDLVHRDRVGELAGMWNFGIAKREQRGDTGLAYLSLRGRLLALRLSIFLSSFHLSPCIEMERERTVGQHLQQLQVSYG